MVPMSDTMRRIGNARRAMMRAQDPKFKEFWRGVVNELSKAYD